MSKNFIAEFKQVVFQFIVLYKTVTFIEKIIVMDYNNRLYSLPGLKKNLYAKLKQIYNATFLQHGYKLGISEN